MTGWSVDLSCSDISNARDDDDVSLAQLAMNLSMYPIKSCISECLCVCVLTRSRQCSANKSLAHSIPRTNPKHYRDNPRHSHEKSLKNSHNLPDIPEPPPRKILWTNLLDIPLDHSRPDVSLGSEHGLHF